MAALVGQRLPPPTDVMDVFGTCGRDAAEAAYLPLLQGALDAAPWIRGRGSARCRRRRSPSQFGWRTNSTRD